MNRLTQKKCGNLVSMQIPPKESISTVRYVSFNVNGVKTVFNYSPWNKLAHQDLNGLFQYMHADIITLQELKLSPLNLSSTVPYIGHLEHYRSFISLPRVKKGYSGVGLFIRVPNHDDPPAVRNHLTVIKAEQGISGYLEEDKVAYRDLKDNIGGYQEDLDRPLGLLLDSEGRCVVVELACNLVIFALYCPANSMGTEDGEKFRLAFLKAVFDRSRNLTKQGKQVMIIGDINVSLDLIDHADTINELQKDKVITPNSMLTGPTFETSNYEQCVAFKTSTPARTLINSTVWSTLHQEIGQKNNDDEHPFLFDTTRYCQGRRMKMYTVWNTLTNSRSVNYGSRIDLCLISCPKLLASISQADIWPSILGSDHCPIATDFDLTQEEEIVLPPSNKLAFEAKNFFKLTKPRDISALFGSATKRQKTDSNSTSLSTTEVTTSTDKKLELDTRTLAGTSKSTLIYTSRKPKHNGCQKLINSFFTQKK